MASRDCAAVSHQLRLIREIHGILVAGRAAPTRRLASFGAVRTGWAARVRAMDHRRMFPISCRCSIISRSSCTITFAHTS